MGHTQTSIDLTIWRRKVRSIAELLRTLGNEDRLVLLRRLCQGECSVGELEAELDIRQPTLSQQLGVLRDKGLVATRRDGKRIHYRIADDSVVSLLAYLDGLGHQHLS